MDLKEGIEKLKGLIEKFGAEKPTETVDVKFKDMKLEDGTTIISIDGEELAIGVPVYVVTPEGRVPAPDGEVVLEDGTKVTVMQGLVAEVSSPEEEAPEGEVASEPATVPPAAEEQPAAMETKPKRVIKSQVEEHVFNAFKEQVEAINKAQKEEIETLKAELEKVKAEFSKSLEFSKEVFSVVEKIADEPSAKPTEEKAKPFNVKEFKAAFKQDLKNYYKSI